MQILQRNGIVISANLLAGERASRHVEEGAAGPDPAVGKTTRRWLRPTEYGLGSRLSERRRRSVGARATFIIGLFATLLVAGTGFAHPIRTLGLGSIGPVAFTQDGKLLAVGGSAASIQLLDVTTGRVVRWLEGHTGGILVLRLSPDGSLLASGSSDSEIRLWSTQTWQEVACLRGHLGAISDIGFSPDGKTLVSSSNDVNLDHQTLIAWSVPDHRKVADLIGPEWGVTSVAFSPDGKLLASTGLDGVLRLWDTTRWTEVRKIEDFRWQTYDARFSADGRMVICSDWDGVIRLYDVATGLIQITWEHGIRGMSTAMSPGGELFAVANGDVRLWNLRTLGQQDLYAEEKLGDVWDVAFAPDGIRAVAGTSDGKVLIINTKTRIVTQLGEITANAWLGRKFAPDIHVAFSRDGKYVVASSPAELRIWPVGVRDASADLLVGYNLPNVTCVHFSPDGQDLATASSDGVVRLWSLEDGLVYRTLSGGGEIDYGLGGVALATVLYGKPHIYDLAEHDDHPVDTRPATSAGGEEDYGALTFDATGRVLSVAGNLGIWEYDPSDGHSMGVRVWGASPSELCLTPDGGTIVGIFGGDVEIWNVSAGQLVGPLLEFDYRDAAEDVAVSPDGARVAVACYYSYVGPDKATYICVFDLATRKLLWAAYEDWDHLRDGFSVAFSPNGRLLASGSSDGYVRLWDAETGQELAELLGHTGSAVAFSPDGRLLASAGGDVVKLWDLQSEVPSYVSATPRMSTGLVLFEEDFADSTPGVWYEGDSGNAQFWVGDGSYNVQIECPPAEGWVSCAQTDALFEDCEVSVTARSSLLPGGWSVGVALRCTAAGDCYVFMVTGEGFFSFSRRAGGEWADLQGPTYSSLIKTGLEPNRLSVIADGAHFACFVNGKQVAELEDRTISSGRAGVFASATHEGVFEMEFDSVSVVELQ